MSKRFKGVINIDVRESVPDWDPYVQPILPEGTPSVLYIVLDDVGFSAMQPFSGMIETPNIDRIDKYKGKFDMGYEAYRELVFARQKQLGVMPEHAELSPINPYIDESTDGTKAWSQLDVVRPWDSLSDDEKKLFCRMAEVYAGFLSRADHEIGRLLDYLEESGQLDNTMIILVSDNGASGEGGPNGSVNENKIFNGIPDSIEANLPYLDELGGPRTYNVGRLRQSAMGTLQHRRRPDRVP
jgi:arylsulfatase A-like enzyme